MTPLPDRVTVVATALIALGVDQAAAILQHWPSDLVDRVTRRIAELTTVDPTAQEAAWATLAEALNPTTFSIPAGIDVARDLIARVLGPDEAQQVLRRFRPRAFAALRTADVQQIVTLLQGQHPQVAAVVLAHLPSDIAAQALQAWPPDDQGAIAWRIATLRPMSPDVVHALEEPLAQLLDALADQETGAGVGLVASILNEGDTALENTVLTRLDETDPPLAEAIRARLFPFEQVVQLDDRAMQQVLRQVDNATLAKALKGASSAVQEKIFRNLSTKAQAILRDDMEV
ncbi:MAG: flagellar motor switch protein FliG, partial [Sulfobacillus sp.]|nr:flagellar motor switch protein FliG [Sulfobacillus sp.]